MIWSLCRGSMYVIAFLVVMLGDGPGPLAVRLPGDPAPPSCIGAAFSAAGLATTAYLRTVQDFDLPMGLVVMPMFLFSGTFFPISFYPAADPAADGADPALPRRDAAARADHRADRAALAWDVLYLVVFFGICLFIAMRQIERKLIK